MSGRVHMFGVVRGEVTLREFRRCNAIARKHGASFTGGNIPGLGPQHWFVAPNRGEPIDGDTARAVQAAVGEVRTIKGQR